MLIATTYGEVTRFDLARNIVGRGRYWTTAYLIDDLLIDSGCAYTASELAAALEEIRLSTLVNTHTHEDHIGANGRLQREKPALRILAHSKGLPILERPRELQPLQPYQRLFWGWPEPCCAESIEEYGWVETAQYRFQVIYTPGHSQDHLCLYEPDAQWLFSGDLFVGGSDRALRRDYNIWDIIASLKRIAAMPIKALFPGSARVREEPRADLLAKVNYLEITGEKVLALHRQGWGLKAIAREVFGGPGWVEIVTLGHFSRRNLVVSYIHNKPDSQPAMVQADTG